MKKCLIVWSLTLAIFFPVLGHTADFGNIYLRFMEGDVLVKTDDTTEWLPTSSNIPLRGGDKIWSPDNGRAELFHRNGTMVRLDRNTYLEILASDDKITRFYLAEGHAYGNTKVSQGDVVVIETPTASLRAYGQSVFKIDVRENEYTDVAVLRGELFMDRQSGQMKINVGDRIIVRNNGAYPELARIVAADQWEQWNRQRDYDLSLSQSGNSVAYLPDELKAYAPDLERNGRWAYEQEYGYVWTPTVVIAQTWSPYSEGRWVWMNGDYVWISHDSWGWAPHHYGRWVFVNHRGWCWVPPGRGAAHWGPGYVGWVHTSTHISWVPLAPRDTYYGRGNFGAHSVNVRNVTNRNVTVNGKVDYKNVHIRNAVTTVQRDTFANGRPTRVNTKDNLFLKEKSVMAAPERRPEKTILMPVVKDIPLTKLPPQKIRDRVSTVIKNNNSPLTGNQSNGGALSVLLGTKNRPQLPNNRTTDGQQQVNAVPASIEQRKPVVENQDLRKGPVVESGKERADRRLNELRVNNSTRSIAKELPLQPPQALLTKGPEKKVDTARRNPETVGARQPLQQRQIPVTVENTRPLLPAYVNNTVPKPQVQPPKRDENIVAGSRTMPQAIKREIQPEKKGEVIVAPRAVETASVRPPYRIKPEPNGNSKPANMQQPAWVEQRKSAPVEKEAPEKRTQMKRVDQKPDMRHQPAPVKISQVNENNRGSVSGVPVPAGRPNGRNEGRNAGR